jgi:hypothetical protein
MPSELISHYQTANTKRCALNGAGYSIRSRIPVFFDRGRRCTAVRACPWPPYSEKLHRLKRPPPQNTAPRNIAGCRVPETAPPVSRHFQSTQCICSIKRNFAIVRCPKLLQIWASGEGGIGAARTWSALRPRAGTAGKTIADTSCGTVGFFVLAPDALLVSDERAAYGAFAEGMPASVVSQPKHRAMFVRKAAASHHNKIIEGQRGRGCDTGKLRHATGAVTVAVVEQLARGVVVENEVVGILCRADAELVRRQ